MQPRRSPQMCYATRFQSSPAPEGRCNDYAVRPVFALDVSILTGPGGPVQLISPLIDLQREMFQSLPAPEGRCNANLDVMLKSLQQVSILTGPGGPVQP